MYTTVVHTVTVPLDYSISKFLYCVNNTSHVDVAEPKSQYQHQTVSSTGPCF